MHVCTYVVDPRNKITLNTGTIPEPRLRIRIGTKKTQNNTGTIPAPIRTSLAHMILILSSSLARILENFRTTNTELLDSSYH